MKAAELTSLSPPASPDPVAGRQADSAECYRSVHGQASEVLSGIEAREDASSHRLQPRHSTSGEQLLARAADHDTVDEMAKMAAASKARMEEAMFRMAEAE